MKRQIALLYLLSIPSVWAELPDITSVEPDLVVPEMTSETPIAGRRVRLVTEGWKSTGVYHSLYLPSDWNSKDHFPVIVEWTGNGNFKNAFGDTSSGRPEDAKLGYGISSGKGFIWLNLPYLNAEGTENVITWWGTPPGYSPEPTLAYCRATLREVCEKFGGDPHRVILAGFSRGSIACNYLGLYDDETARLWRGFVCYSHYDGVRRWPFPASDRSAALARLKRLNGRPQFICGEQTNADETRDYLNEIGFFTGGNFTIQNTGFRNHNDAWILRPNEARTKLREWIAEVLK